MKTGRIQERIATAHEIYKKYLGDDVNIEIDDVLRDKFRNLSMVKTFTLQTLIFLLLESGTSSSPRYS